MKHQYLTPVMGVLFVLALEGPAVASVAHRWTDLIDDTWT